MTQDSGQLDNSVLAAGSVAGAGTGQSGDGSSRFRGSPRSGSTARCRGCSGRSRLWAASARSRCCSVGVFLVVAFATAGASVLVPQSSVSYPSWEAGPLHVLHGALGSLLGSPHGLNIGLSAVLVVMLIAYAALLATVNTLSMRLIVITVIALHAILLLSPPQQLTDLFNYLGYARLGGLHHLNPYTQRDRPGGARPGVPVQHLAPPAQPLRTAVHRAHLSAGVAAGAGRLLDPQGGHGADEPGVHRAGRAVRPRARARPAVRDRVRRRQPDLPDVRDPGLPQRLLHAGADRPPRWRCCCRTATARPGRW